MKLIKILFLVLFLSIQSIQAKEPVNVNFSGMLITDFVKLIAKVNNKNILINHQINGSIDLVTTTTIYNDELIGILISVLESKGFTLVENGSLYEIVHSADASKSGLKVVNVGQKTNGSIMVTQSIPIETENVDIIAAKVRYLISKTAKLMTLKETNTLLITDYPKNIENIKKVIRDISKTKKKTLKIIKIVNANAKLLFAKVSDIANTVYNVNVDTEKIKVILDENLNSLILFGNTENVSELSSTVVELDKEKEVHEKVKIFNLKNSDSASILKTLNEIISQQTYPDESLKPKLSVNEAINSIIVVGQPHIIKGIADIINELDKEKYQVYVQARIVEINNDASEKLGIKYGIDGGIANTSGLYTLAANFGGASIAPMNPNILTKLADSLGNLDSALALGATLDFLQSNGASKTISNPSILCVNNQESSIYVGKTLSFQTGEATNSAGGTTNSFKREDVGLKLEIKPRVSSKEKVTLDVSTTLENVVAINDTNNQPVTTKQTVNTQAILKHGESIIIGGLIKSYQTDITSKVPILGYIPFLGELFTHHEERDQQDNLLVILTPYVIDKSAQLSKLQEELGELGKLQKEYNKVIFSKIESKDENKEVISNDDATSSIDEEF